MKDHTMSSSGAKTLRVPPEAVTLAEQGHELMQQGKLAESSELLAGQAAEFAHVIRRRCIG